MLPGRNGFQVCADLREAGDWTPILMLTAKDGELDEAEALDTGADDYLTKPFSFPVLVARVRALLRRAAGRSAGARRGRRPAHRPGGPPGVARRRGGRADGREFDVLEFLVRRAGQVLSKDEILAGVWEYDFDGDPNIVEVYVGRLRRKLDEPFGRRHDRDRPRRRLPPRRDALSARAGRTVRWRVTALATAAIVVVLVAAGVGPRRRPASALTEQPRRDARCRDRPMHRRRRRGRPDARRSQLLGDDDAVAQVVDARRRGRGASRGDRRACGRSAPGRRGSGSGRSVRYPAVDDDDVRSLSRGRRRRRTGRSSSTSAAPVDDIDESVATLRRRSSSPSRSSPACSPR